MGTGGRPARARQEGAPRAGPPGLRDAAPHFLKPVSCGRTRPLRRPPPPGPGPHCSGEAPLPAAALTALLLHVPPPDATPGPVTTRRPARTAPAERLAGAHSGATPASPRAGAPPWGVSSRLRSFCRPGCLCWPWGRPPVTTWGTWGLATQRTPTLSSTRHVASGGLQGGSLTTPCLPAPVAHPPRPLDAGVTGEARGTRPRASPAAQRCSWSEKIPITAQAPRVPDASASRGPPAPRAVGAPAASTHRSAPRASAPPGGCPCREGAAKPPASGPGHPPASAGTCASGPPWRPPLSERV